MKARFLMTLALCGLVQPAFAGATFTVVNVNAPGIGFNDPTPAAPVGGNAGTTVGEQRLIAFQYAADLWGTTLDSNVEIRVQASFESLACTPTAGTLGSAGPLFVIDFPPADPPAIPAPPLGAVPSTWYTIAEANKLSGVDNAPDGNDIRARFNANLGTPTCLAASSWYYGLDTNHAPNQINLVTVLLHEFAHGLGFLSLANPLTGELFFDQTDIYQNHYRDNSTGRRSAQMTAPERQQSFANPRNVVWTGNRVTSSVPTVLNLGTPLLQLASPSSIAGDYPIGAAAFGPPVSSPGVSGSIVQALDGVGSTFDACEPIDNAAAVTGRIALVDRGVCAFAVKVKNAQLAGAIAVLVANNAPGGPPTGLGGADPTITIPSVLITQEDGDLIKAALTTGPVTGSLNLDLTIRSGADRKNRAMLFTPNPVQPGSSISHWDTSASPNQLMEPAINVDLTLSLTAPHDLTLAQMRDIGWYLDRDVDRVPDEKGDQCLPSNLADTVIIGGIDTTVPNVVVPTGCTISDYITSCSTIAKNHGAYVSCVAKTTKALRDGGYLTRDQRGAIQRAVAKDK